MGLQNLGNNSLDYKFDTSDFRVGDIQPMIINYLLRNKHGNGF